MQRLTRIFHNRLLKDVSTVLGGASIVRLIGFFTTWLLVRHLAPADFGLFSVIDTVSGITAGLLTTGLNWAMIRSIAANRDLPDKAWTVARAVLKLELIYGLTIAFSIYLTAGFVAQKVFSKPELSPYLRLCSIGVIGTILITYRTSIFQAFGQFKLEAAFSISQSTAYLAIILFLITLRLCSIRLIAIFYVGLPAVISIIALLKQKKNFLSVKRTATINFMVTMSSTYGWLLLYTLCQWFVAQFHVLILTRYFSLQEVGLYGFAYKIYGLSLLLMTALNAVLLPTFSRIADRQLLRDSFRGVLKASGAVFVLLIAVTPFLGYFVRVFAGLRYIAATSMLQLLILGAATSTVLSPAVNILFALEKYKAIAIGGLMLFSLNLAGHLLITRQVGGVGAASVQVLSHLALNGYFTYRAHKETSTQFQFCENKENS